MTAFVVGGRSVIAHGLSTPFCVLCFVLIYGWVTIKYIFYGNFSKFWKNKPVIVTGSNGFVGKHLTERLLSLGALVVPLSRSAGISIDVTDRASLTPFFEKEAGCCVSFGR